MSSSRSEKSTVPDEDGYVSAEDSDYAPDPEDEVVDVKGGEVGAISGPVVKEEVYTSVMEDEDVLSFLDEVDDSKSKSKSKSSKSNSEGPPDADGGTGSKRSKKKSGASLTALLNGSVRSKSSKGEKKKSTKQLLTSLRNLTSGGYGRDKRSRGEGGASAAKRARPSKTIDLEVARKAKELTRTDKTTVTETVRFAGQTIQVTRLLNKGTVAEGEYMAKKLEKEKKQSSARVVPRGPGLAQVVANLDKPSSVSTAEKSALDWAVYKDAHGIEDELKRHNQDGYLAKKDFLQRVDERVFELEKADRAIERAKRDREAAHAKSRQ